ncbi:MAG: hypothetical protein AAF851_05720 [Myxococcota bacterium]
MTNRGGIDVDLRFPIAMRVRLNANEINKRVGNRVAAIVRRYARKGQRTDGAAMPVSPSDKDGRALWNTGRLVKSIGYRGGSVFAKGKRDDVGPSLRGRNAALLAVHIARRGPELNPMQVTEELRREGAKAAQKEIERQLSGRSRRSGLILEIKAGRSVSGRRR